MGTRSYIGKLYSDGSVKAIYCHWDGYPDHVGCILKKVYNCDEVIEELISLGDLSSLGANLYPDPSRRHTFDNPQKDVCVFYGRDRGETGQEAEELRDRDHFVMDGGHRGAAWMYLWTGDKWDVIKPV